MNSVLLLRKRTYYPSSQVHDLSLPSTFRKLKENTQLFKLLVKLALTLTLISAFFYFSYKWFAFEFSVAKSKYASVFLEKAATKAGIAAGIWDSIVSGVSQGISAAAGGVQAVGKAVTEASNIVQETANGITGTVVKVVGEAASTVSDSVSNVITGYNTIGRDTVITWSWIGGSGLLGLLLALLFIL